ncbi:hypothetical protein K443DRAFT_381500 [Laccaria amethystina LaAM-08-1]|uniref:Uncharacterized protein n=1 Tax=Laccaria amethystina LaAM-08-1 TaxID=1095629 RepID=A0A0C9WQZ7_9AGAR|nr:hypothetical protein K443DRAFT_381500 [Laccaria amethystina LaAM-08-1]
MAAHQSNEFTPIPLRDSQLLGSGGCLIPILGTDKGKGLVYYCPAQTSRSNFTDVKKSLPLCHSST